MGGGVHHLQDMTDEFGYPTVVGEIVGIQHQCAHFPTIWDSTSQLIVTHIQNGELLQLCEGRRS